VGLVRADIVVVPLARDMPVYVWTVLNNSTELHLDTGGDQKEALGRLGLA
jgi:hypothetical protein